MNDWLQGLKVGDPVTVNMASLPSVTTKLGKVSRAAKASVEVMGFRYSRTNGRMIDRKLGAKWYLTEPDNPAIQTEN